MNHGMTWQQYEEEYGYDFEQLYQRRLTGEGWRNLASEHMNKGTVMSKLREYCMDKGRDFRELEKVNSNRIIEDPGMVDKGKIKALARARWTISNIAVDCHCTEECVIAVLQEKGKNNGEG